MPALAICLEVLHREHIALVCTSFHPCASRPRVRSPALAFQLGFAAPRTCLGYVFGEALAPTLPRAVQANEKMKALLAKLGEHKRRRAFLLGFSHAPADFVNALVASQVRITKWYQVSSSPHRKFKISLQDPRRNEISWRETVSKAL